MSDQKRNGCFNRKPFKEEMLARDGYALVNSTSSHRIVAVALKEIPFVMSRDCQHDRRHTDPGCNGCIWIDGNDADIREKADVH